MDKKKVFEIELNLIRSLDIKKYAEKAIEYLPDYFFEIPASSTGKYHPSYTQGSGGLVRHVKACVRFAIECFRLRWYSGFTEDEKDLILVSLLLHDGWKSGTVKTEYTLDDHAIIATKQLQENEELCSMLPSEYLEKIYDNISTHMGQWRFYRKTNEAFAEEPSSASQKLVHFIDYTCSRKMFEANFDVIPQRE